MGKKMEKAFLANTVQGTKIKKSREDWIFDIIIYTISVLFMLICIYPVYFVLIASFSSPTLVGSGKVMLWPKGVTFEAYKRLFEYKPLWIGYRNTIFYTLGCTLVGLFVNVTAGYALSQKNLPGGKGIMVFYLIPMFFGGGLVPTYLLVRALHLTNTIWVILIPFSVSVSNILVCRTFFRSNLSEELWDSAQIDGCAPIPYFIKVALPLSKAILAVIGLWTAVGEWNEYYTALLYLNDENLTTLQLVLRRILIMNQTLIDTLDGNVQGQMQEQTDALKYAAIVVSTVPVMCLYPFVQKYFNQGVMLGSVKG